MGQEPLLHNEVSMQTPASLSTVGNRVPVHSMDFKELLGRLEAAWTGDPALSYCSEATGKVTVDGFKNVRTFPPPLTSSCVLTPTQASNSLGTRTHSVPCGLDGSDQATMGDSAGDSALSSSASSSWEGSLFLQGHGNGKGLQQGQGPEG